ncbi:hypothetical protein DICPUDRAFT_44210 [Dictyostelium purpureum]|uniref:Palmitoyltransferase n=1 Tax=Dictyostelium purpureum TaxID=5786 RepID=F1A5Q0_DICPU|nr:uncharacterized protein DICPUDRAFT_44210 [Dictyostelium purpureum]EGC28481.1 hypothetical protein DICPUDRAFT_44210 [Dictyostelium purpureum]|eukprot:XP_003294995.1 hypothetical protein DICPUDRAFT_44210 [Dictyostelium purpureum]
MTKSYASKSKSFFNNRFITGPDRSYFILALILMFVPEIPFLIFICPLFQEWITPAIYVVSIYLWIGSYIFMLEAAFTDPGIIPRGVYDDDAFSQRQPLYKKITVKDQILEIKWCDTCCLYKPPRANHCGICNNCVEHFDHHCPYIGNCIGRRNYQAFLYYLCTLGFKCLFIIGFCIAHIVIEAVRYRRDHEDASSAKVFNEAMSKSHYLSIIFITYKKGNPYKKSYWRNFIEAFSPPRYPSYIKFTIDNEKELSDLPIASSQQQDIQTNNGDTTNLYTPPISPPTGIRYSLDNLRSSTNSNKSSKNDENNQQNSYSNNINNIKNNNNNNSSGNNNNSNNENKNNNQKDESNSNSSSGAEAYDEDDDQTTNDGDDEDFKSDNDKDITSVSMNHELQVHS